MNSSKKGKILLINGVFNTTRMSEPIGICSIAAVLRQAGHAVHILEPRLMDMDIDSLSFFAAKENWTYIGISTFSFEKERIYDLAIRIKKLNPDSFILIGGLGPTLTPELFLSECEYIDAVMCGEGEYASLTLVEYLLEDSDRWKDCPGIVYANQETINIVPPLSKICNLDELPYMARDVLQLNINKYGRKYVTASIMGSRGCFGNCSYCWISEAQKRQPGLRYRQRSIESIVGEIKYIVESFNITDFAFDDDNFLPEGQKGVQRAYDFRDKLKEAGLSITFFMQTRPDTLYPESIEALKDAGLTKLFIGIEAISEDDLAIYNKSNSSQRNIKNIISMLKTYGFDADVDNESKGRLRFGYIAFHQLTTLKSVKNSVNFFREHNLTPKRLLTRVKYFDGDIEIKNKLIEKGLLLEQSDDVFVNREVGLIYKNISFYSDLTMPLRESLRDIEKHVFRTIGNKNCITELSRFRQYIDESFFDSFDILIDIIENSYDNMADIDAQMKSRMECMAANIFNKYKDLNIEDICNDAIIKFSVKPGMHITYW